MAYGSIPAAVIPTARHPLRTDSGDPHFFPFSNKQECKVFLFDDNTLVSQLELVLLDLVAVRIVPSLEQLVEGLVSGGAVRWQ